jgi:hypothetical protein
VRVDGHAGAMRLEVHLRQQTAAARQAAAQLSSAQQLSGSQASHRACGRCLADFVEPEARRSVAVEEGDELVVLQVVRVAADLQVHVRPAAAAAASSARAATAEATGHEGSAAASRAASAGAAASVSASTAVVNSRGLVG